MSNGSGASSGSGRAGAAGGRDRDQVFSRELELSSVVTSWETAAALAPFHILREEVVRERFDYDACAGIHVAFVRVFRLQPAVGD